MKSSKSSSRPAIFTLLTLLLIFAVVILAGLTIILGMIARDYLLTGDALALNPAGTLTPTSYQTSEVLIGLTQKPIEPTLFQPLPTSTITPTPSFTPTSTLTQTSTPIPTETFTAIPEWPPESAQISNITGYFQTYTLDCESRSAVDWAAYFGVTISEFEFLDSLPRSDDPNQGFVGDPNGVGGLTPPNSYGVHAGPVARLLQSYGLSAKEEYGLDKTELKIEIASGRPVIAWVIIGTGLGYSVEYTTNTGEVIDVAPYEHTVIVIGYDPNGVTILDGGTVYLRDWATFDASFGVLNNMAVIYRPD